MARNWDVKNLYYYLVCLVTLIIFIFGFISAVNSILFIVMPNKPNIPVVHLHHFEGPRYFTETDGQAPTLSELKQMREEQEAMQYSYNNWANQRLLNSSAMLIITIPFYLYHWNRVKPKTREEL